MMFDPILRGKGTISKYTYGFEKKKTVDIVRWLEKNPARPSSNRFMVVYNDGMIAFYHKDKEVPQTMQVSDKQGNSSTVPYDVEKDILRLGDEKVSRLQVMKRMRAFVEEYSFDDYFMIDPSMTMTKKKGELSPLLPNAQGIIKANLSTEWSTVKLRENIHSRR